MKNVVLAASLFPMGLPQQVKTQGFDLAQILTWVIVSWN